MIILWRHQLFTRLLRLCSVWSRKGSQDMTCSRMETVVHPTGKRTVKAAPTRLRQPTPTVSSFHSTAAAPTKNIPGVPDTTVLTPSPLRSQSYPLSGINPASVSDNFTLFLFFWNRVSPYNSGCLGTHFIDLVGLKLQDLPASSSRVLGLKAYPTDTHMLKSF